MKTEETSLKDVVWIHCVHDRPIYIVCPYVLSTVDETP